MMLYSQRTGAFTLGGKVIGYGYAGNGPDKNEPRSQGKKGHGPLPQHQYKLTTVKDSPRTGPFTIVLEPVGSGDMLGRGDFRIHGDSIKAPGTASDGCIILPRNLREKIWSSGERLLTVTI
jgi:hypothetical protein